VKDGEAIIMDASSTVLYMAGCLSKRRNLTVVTNGLRVARLLAKEPTNKIILAAPVLRADGNALGQHPSRPADQSAGGQVLLLLLGHFA
jgi:DeoR/GlpR family transcriptional regulator of sugar metabolism